VCPRLSNSDFSRVANDPSLEIAPTPNPCSGGADRRNGGILIETFPDHLAFRGGGFKAVVSASLLGKGYPSMRNPQS
jgi:hypothetical protein